MNQFDSVHKGRDLPLSALDTPLTLDKTRPLDTAITRRVDGAKAFFLKGVTSVRTTVKQLEQKLRNTTDPAEQAALRRDLRRLSFYTAFDFKVIAVAVRAGLER